MVNYVRLLDKGIATEFLSSVALVLPTLPEGRWLIACRKRWCLRK